MRKGAESQEVKMDKPRIGYISAVAVAALTVITGWWVAATAETTSTTGRLLMVGAAVIATVGLAIAGSSVRGRHSLRMACAMLLVVVSPTSFFYPLNMIVASVAIVFILEFFLHDRNRKRPVGTAK